MIRVRFDDVLQKSKAYSDPFGRFKYFYELVRDSKNFYPSPNILVQDIMEFPECIEYLKNETERGNTVLDLHGYTHNPSTLDGRNCYSSLSELDILISLDAAFQWWSDAFGKLPERWVTPHGGTSPAMEAAAQKFSITIETTDPPVIDQRDAWGRMNKGEDISFLDDSIIMNHWWERGHALERIVLVKDHGWVEAANIKPEIFR